MDLASDDLALNDHLVAAGVRHLTIAGYSCRALADGWFEQWPVPVWVKLRPRLANAATNAAELLNAARMQLDPSTGVVAAASARTALISLRIELISRGPLQLRVYSYIRHSLRSPFGNRPYNTISWRE